MASKFSSIGLGWAQLVSTLLSWALLGQAESDLATFRMTGFGYVGQNMLSLSCTWLGWIRQGWVMLGGMAY